jgi:sarcosine oxidase subunit delta
MKRLRCPANGYRNISEFTYGGEYRPEPVDCSEREWADFVYFDDNSAGTVFEWWCHTATSYWFVAERNTVSDKIMHTFSVAEFQSSERTA